MTISRIGPVAVAAVVEPAAVQVSGAGVGAPSIRASFRVPSRTEAEQLEELVNNPARRQTIRQASGVLEWVEAAGADARWRGWWLIDSCEISMERMQRRRTDPAAAYVPVSLSARYLGVEGKLSVVATHRAQATDFAGVTSQALVAPLYPSRNVLGAGVVRTSEAGAVGVLKSSAKRLILSADGVNFNPAAIARPRIRDAAGVHHYGPRRSSLDADGLSLYNAHVRVTIGQTAANHWLVEAWIAGAWYSLGALSVRRTSGLGAAVAWAVAGTTLADDRAGVMLANNSDGSTVLAEVRAGELGARLTCSAQYYLRWVTTADAAAGAATKSGNAYQDSVAHANGSRRMLAITRTQLAESLADWEVRVAAGNPALAGFVPSAPAADDTSVEQGRQLLSDRTEQLTLV